MIIVKGNQKDLHKKMDKLFESEMINKAEKERIIESEMREYTTLDSKHGRVEERRIRAVCVKENLDGWVGVKQWCQIKRTVWKKENKSIDYAYAITSLAAETHDAQALLELNRNHWGVEVFHWHKDTLLREDASTIRTKNAPAAIAAIRNLTLFFLKKINPSLKIAHETLANNQKLINIITNNQHVNAKF
jgi:predicted transposase YbfD/YdcC